jgi:hypothetical protein
MFSIGVTLSFIGEILLAISLYLVHGKILKEKKLDKKVFMELYKEEIIIIVSVILLISGYILQIMNI